ncbi:MAG: hypothetical protein GWN71_22240, partial [Gammaproteobacteria bacterium]|nr:hypothetical protein [Gemmatimonadota bacterium]NIU76181.1 hypothetical protein [Gammaproteobacteria bacterium]NIW75290.1 hypothetical protein [Gemmatimonadota bacterium]
MSGDPYTIAGRFTLWYGFFGGPIAWTLHLLVSYAPVEVDCAGADPALLHGITIATALVALGAAAVGWRAWRRARGAESAVPADDGAAVRRTRFMGLCGMI